MAFFDQRIDDLRSAAFADDVDYDESMVAWSDDEITLFFESGGVDRPVVHISEESVAKPTGEGSSQATPTSNVASSSLTAAPGDAPETESQSTSVPPPPVQVSVPALHSNRQQAVEDAGAASPTAAAPPPADVPICVACEAGDGSASWQQRDARLLAFLESSALLKLAEPLRKTTLAQLVGLPRLELLAHLKAAGVANIAERQKFANGLAKALKEGTLPPEDCARPAEPPPTCDACDGPHRTDACPYFKKARDDHPDAKVGSGKKSLFGSTMKGPAEVLQGHAARVIRQPGDGSCLFHSLAHGLRNGTSAGALRREIADFIEANADLEIADSPLKDWVQWDAQVDVPSYCRKMRAGSAWGGGIEMAAASHLKGVHVLVYEPDRASGGFKRIGTFEPPAASPSTVTGAIFGTSKSGGAKREVRIVYQGGVHYDALELGGGGSSYGGSPILGSSAYTGLEGSFGAMGGVRGLGGTYNGLGSLGGDMITARGGGNSMMRF